MRNSTLQVFLVLLLVGWPLVATSAGVFYDNTPEDISGGGTITGDIRLVPATSPIRLYEPARTTDAAPYRLQINAGDAYPLATGANLLGGNTYLRGGIGARTITVTNYALASGDTVVMAISTTSTALTSTTLTAGTTFTCITSNNACATALAAAIDALAGVSATATGAVVAIVPDGNAMSVTITIADGGVDGAFATASASNSGQVLIGMGTSSAPALAMAAYPTAGFGYGGAANYMCTFSALSPYLCWGGNLVTLSKPMNVGSQYIYSYGALTQMGGATSTSHSLAEGDFVFKDEIEVNGTTWLDGSLYAQGIFKDVGATCTQGEIAVDTGGGTVELCACTATNNWYCAHAEAGPDD